MSLRRKNENNRLGKTMTTFRYGKNLDQVRLPRLEQEGVYRRNSILEKKSLMKSNSTFYQTKTGSRSWAPVAHTTNETFYNSLSGTNFTGKNQKYGKVNVKQMFAHTVNKFIVKSGSKSFSYKRMSQKGKISLAYNKFLLSKHRMKGFSLQITKAEKSKTEFLKLIKEDKFKRNMIKNDFRNFRETLSNEFKALREETFEVGEQVDILTKKMKELNLKMRKLKTRTEGIEKASGIHVASALKEYKVPKLGNDYEHTNEMLASIPYNKTYQE